MSYIFEKKKLYSYLGPSLVAMLKLYNGYVAGGCITSLFTNRDINDVDIYFRSKEDAGDFIGEIIEDRNWILSHTNKATAFKYDDITCQVIHFDYFPTPETIFKKFDFTVCMGAFDFSKEEFVLQEDFLKHNCQKILKFNENTAYPIISALRVQKYEDKHYKISKPEYIKILLTCMNLNITNYEDLKEQMGGMYGVNYDRLLKPENEKEFYLSDVINKITDLVVNDDYFNKPEEYKFPDSIEDLAVKISGKKIKVFKFRDSYYKFKYNDFECIDEDSIKQKDIYELVNIKEFIKKGIKFYKFVKKNDNKYFSFHDEKFEYFIGKTVVPNNSSSYFSNTAGIYCGYIQNCGNFTHRNNKNAVLLELELLDINDIIEFNNLRLSKALVVREVPKEEYEKYL